MPRTPTTVKTSRYTIPNLERGLKIMEHLLDYPEGLQQSEIAAHLGYAKSSIFRVTMTLIEFGYLERGADKSLRLTRKLLAMGSRALEEKDLMATSIDTLKKLRDAVQETVLIGALVDGALIVLGQVLGSHPFKFSVDIGTRLPLHTAAPAKAILAFLPEAERLELIKGIKFTRYTPNTITSSRAYQKELEQIAQSGFALDNGEQLTGIHCVAAPVFNRFGYPIAGVWTTGPADRLPQPDLPLIGAKLIEHTRIISARLGHGLL